MNIQIAKPEQWWAEGTSLVGYFDATWTDLNTIFGPIPVYELSADDKTSISISLRIDKEVITIYDWKESYLPGHKPNATYEFHIGGCSTKAVEKLKEYFESINRMDLAETTRAYGK
jgi:hypothetical protein